MNSWNYKTYDLQTLQRMNYKNISSQLISSIKTDYEKKPKDSSYTDLQIFAAFKEEVSGMTFLMFDILYVSDITVVYEVDGNGNIVGKFLQSSWK